MAETRAVEEVHVNLRSHFQNNRREISHSTELPAEIKDWDKEHVRDWILTLTDVDNENAKILYEQDINGPSLLLLETSEIKDIGIKLGPAKLIIHHRDELKAHQLKNSGSLSCTSCKPYPFNRFHAAYRYKENSILDVIETGALNFIEPCHEYKAFINFQNVTTEEKLKKFTDEVIRFACACMNSRTNGTIHFGVGDLPEFSHGQILGASVEDKETFAKKLAEVIKVRFEHKHTDVAKKCIKPPRFVEVLEADMTFSGKYVIEVDVEPSYLVCKDSFFHIYNLDSRKAKRSKITTDEKDSGKLFYIRDNSSSRNLLCQTSSPKSLEEYNKHVESMAHLSKLRMEAEEKHLTVVKSSVQGSKLCEMLTGGSQSLDKSHFEQYVLVINKSHPVQRESLAFLLDMKLTAVLDFDPESAETGLNKLFDERNTNVHLPIQYKITEPVEDIVNKLKLTRATSWVFCNGRVNGEPSSDVDNWLTEKGSSIRDVVSFLCRKDVLPHKRFLIIFILLSDVTDKHDPLLETFSMFLQELRGIDQILCICEHERAFNYWKDLTEARYSIHIHRRCIYEPSFAEINGTVLSLWSENRKSSRFLPGVGGKVLLTKKIEGSWDTLNVLCVNQCEGGNEDKLQLEETFYKGGKVSWWNFYFSEQAGSMPFIKRDKFEYIIDTIIPDMCSLSQACVRFNIFHIPGCGGTTLAMHVLWTLKEKFRCAILKNKDVDYEDVAKQVVNLLTYETTEQQPRLSVLLLIDDFEDSDAVSNLQQHIEKECRKKNVSAKSPQVILLNCMRADSWEQTEATDDTVFIGNKLSETEQILFEKKLEEIEKIYQKNAETFYGFMILKKDFSPEYIQGVVKNTLKGFNFKNKNAQLIAVLVLLNCYCKSAKMSVSICEEFLGLPTRPDSTSCKVEDGFGKFSTLVTRCTAESSVEFQAMRVIHSSMAEHCLKELTTTFNVSQAQITDFLLTTDVFYSCIQGKEKLMQDIHTMLVRRHYSAESVAADAQFSPLIQAIAKETVGYEENVLLNAAKRFKKDAVISQLLSRYHYLKKKDFREAKVWAKKAKDLQGNNSYICDTSAQVIKHELQDALSNDKKDEIKPDKLKEYLQMARSAIKAFRETQEIARKEVLSRSQTKKDFSPYNTAGHLGELQVAVMVIKILEKIPVFSLDKLRHDILSQVLSGKIELQNVEAKDPLRQKNASYYHFLKEFPDLLYNLKDNMKKHFDFLDKYFVNLSLFYSQKDTREFWTREKTFTCFQKYVSLFCSSDTKELMRNKTLNTMLKIEKTRQWLEKNKADSYSGLLEFLSKENCNESPGSTTGKIEQVISHYKFILSHTTSPQNDRHVKDKVNFIYANIVLSKISSESRFLMSYMDLLKLVNETLDCRDPFSDSLALHFIAVMMLWPETIPILSGDNLSDRLGSYVSQMRNSFSDEMKPVCNGKRAVVHFYLGKRTGYDRLITQKDIDTCVGSHKTGQLQNGKIWGNKKVQSMLRRVTGNVSKNAIMADTSNPNVKVAVSPLFKSQLCGVWGDRVSFFVGFSMNGPVALDIQPES
ncbi:sterile alpha motif domain-containing protein 9-like isoform X2 [Ictalurus furcatus]|uniref:sterile alpha motif domain-containing protein 9-like isoform X2 n=1 Tax=Ictalurus furcatus TaxID=66913 RepID=UPI00234FF93A|nr:sterile alpha motif domain-containing protein 9-like isoform X2 [Ictalurus furcatus]